ncbi:MAG: two-component system, OmpR family, response regulator [Actinomycetota bacterium]|nr:two-component system, OmpR family, response regulator [Actinomycetota bacterium]
MELVDPTGSGAGGKPVHGGLIALPFPPSGGHRWPRRGGHRHLWQSGRKRRVTAAETDWRGGDAEIPAPADDGFMSTVLVVEDDRDLRDLVRRYLERAGHAVLSTGSGAEGLRLLGEATPDLVVLDLGLPDVDGLDLLREARVPGGRSVPVIILTARNDVEDRITGLSLGADDYVTKPFSPTELALRVGAVLARTSPGISDDGSESFGGGRLVVDPTMRRAVLDGQVLDLTPSEWGVLTTLTSVPGRPFSRYELVNRVRGYEFAGYERSMDSHVKNLRHKLGPDAADVVQTVTGVGYRLGLHRDS